MAEDTPVAHDQTIPGGATLKEDGKTWVDSEGRLLSAEQVAAVKDLLSKQAETNAQQEATLQRQAAMSRNMVVMQAPDAATVEAVQKSTARAQQEAVAQLPDATEPPPAPEEATPARARGNRR